FFLAASRPLRIASGTSPALPMPKPMVPLPSPTTTRALNFITRPPLTVLDTRLMATTFSSMPSSTSRFLLSIVSSSLQLQAALTGALGQSFHAAVIHKATAIEHDGLDAFGQSLLGDHLTDLVRRLDVAAEALKTLLHRG